MIDAWLMSCDSGLLGDLASVPEHARPNAVVVDWEHIDKEARQATSQGTIGMATSIEVDDDDAVRRVRKHGFDRVVCRIDAVGDDRGAAAHSTHQISEVRDQGGTDVLVPMWRSPDELIHVLDAAGDLRVGAMIETVDAIDHCHLLKDLGISFAFVGMVDLALDRRTPSIFAPLADGTLDVIAERLDGLPFGFGGLTLPGCGWPLSDRLLVGELARLGASFSFMRRSFCQHLGATDPGEAIVAIQQVITTALARDAVTVEADHRQLVREVEALNAR
jgi:hypothetical protein